MTDMQSARRYAWQTLACDRGLRLPDRDHRLRAALIARSVSHADVVGAWLGTRSVRAGARDPDADLGRGAAFRRRDCRPLRAGDGACASAPCSMRLGLAWMANASSPGELYLSAGFLTGFGLAGASFTVVIGAFGKLLPARMALAVVRPRHGCRIIRAIPVRADRGRSQWCLSLADDADDFRRHRAC